MTPLRIVDVIGRGEEKQTQEGWKEERIGGWKENEVEGDNAGDARLGGLTHQQYLRNKPIDHITKHLKITNVSKGLYRLKNKKE